MTEITAPAVIIQTEGIYVFFADFAPLSRSLQDEYYNWDALLFRPFGIRVQQPHFSRAVWRAVIIMPFLGKNSIHDNHFGPVRDKDFFLCLGFSGRWGIRNWDLENCLPVWR